MKLLISILFICTISCYGSLSAQEVFNLTKKQADCENAIDITGMDKVQSSAPINSGELMEIKSNKTSLYSFKKEHHTVWYRFTVESDCNLSFKITPLTSSDDYDFILFRSNGNDVCNSIRDGELRPVRSNISRSTELNQGITGLSPKGTSSYVHEGKGNPWSNSISVRKGEVYYLVLDNVYENGAGHQIDFYFKDCDSTEDFKNAPLSLNLNVIDAETNQKLDAFILLVDESKGYGNYDTIYNSKASHLFIPIEANKYYQYEVWAASYLKLKETFQLDSSDNPQRITVSLQPIAIGKTFEIGDVYFEGGKATVLRKSFPALRNLLAIMKDNPSLKIEVQGHVNYSRSIRERKTEEYYNQLSIDRSQAVANYLMKRGVVESRIVCKGFGYSEMVFPNATTQEQMQRNRRVVVKVLSL